MNTLSIYVLLRSHDHDSDFNSAAKFFLISPNFLVYKFFWWKRKVFSEFQAIHKHINFQSEYLCIGLPTIEIEISSPKNKKFLYFLKKSFSYISGHETF